MRPPIDLTAKEAFIENPLLSHLGATVIPSDEKDTVQEASKSEKTSKVAKIGGTALKVVGGIAAVVGTVAVAAM